MIGEPVVVVRDSVTAGFDSRGRPLAPTDALRFVVEGCAVAPRQAEETNETETVSVVSGYDVYVKQATAHTMPPGGVLPTDRVEIRGVTGVVDGDVAYWVSPFRGVPVGVKFSVAVSR